MSLDLFPLVSWDRVDDDLADLLLGRWHYLGACRRPFGRHSFGLQVAEVGIVAVAVSASTVNAACAGWPRGEVVELARLAVHPDHRWATRVALRLWRTVAPPAWAADQWPVRACVSYANTARGHTGEVYRLDGWRKVADVPGGVAGGNWTRGKRYDPKSVWTFVLPEEKAA